MVWYGPGSGNPGYGGQDYGFGSQGGYSYGPPKEFQREFNGQIIHTTDGGQTWQAGPLGSTGPSTDGPNGTRPGGTSPGGGGGAPPFADVYGNKYSSATLTQMEAQMRQLGDIYGVNVTSAMALAAIKQGVGVTEFKNRLTEVQSINSSQGLRNQFQAVLDARGIKADVASFKGGLKFVTGQSEQQFYAVWDEYATRAAATNAGFTVTGKGIPASLHQVLNLSRQDILKVEKGLGLAPDAFDINQLGQAAQQAAQWALAGNLSDSRARGGGLTKVDLIEIASGGGTAQKKQALIRLQTEDQAFASGQGHINTGNPQQTQGGGQVVAGLGNLSG